MSKILEFISCFEPWFMCFFGGYYVPGKVADGRCGGQALQLSWCPSQWLAKAQSTTRQCPSCVLLVWLPAAQSPVAGLFEQMGDGRDGMVGLVAVAGGTFLQIKTCIVEELHIRVCIYMLAEICLCHPICIVHVCVYIYIYVCVCVCVCVLNEWTPCGLCFEPKPS